MRNKCIVWLLLGLLVLFTAASCKSAPPPAEETPPVEETPPAEEAPREETPPPRDPAPDRPALDALDTAAARAGAARKLVGDFEGQSLFVADWSAADALFGEAEQRRNTSTLREAEASTARYNRAADAFEAMTAKTLAGYHEKRGRELTGARNAAINARAQALAPDFLLDADNTALDAETKYQAKDYYGAKDAADKSLFMYTALTAGLDAYKVREEIAERNFEAYDSANIEAADTTLRAAADDYTSQDFASAKEKSDAAHVRYDAALKTAWKSFSAEKGSGASEQRQKALDLKANVAVRQEFNAAQSVFVRANSAFSGERFDEAAKLYDECISSFGVVSRTAMEKRTAAEEALERANQKMAESDETARNAEVILEGGVE